MRERSREQNVGDKITILREADLFRGVSDDILYKAADCAACRQLEPGQVVFSEGGAASGVYLVVRGRLRSFRQNSRGREQVLSAESVGGVLAAAPVFTGGKLYATVIAETAAQLLCIESHAFRDLCCHCPELLWNLAAVLANRLSQYADLIETLALRNVDQRVAQHILIACHQRAVRVHSAQVLRMNLTHAELASRVGSTREVVCRALAHLQHCGLIQLKGATLIVPDICALRNFAGTEKALDTHAPFLNSQAQLRSVTAPSTRIAE